MDPTCVGEKSSSEHHLLALTFTRSLLDQSNNITVNQTADVPIFNKLLCAMRSWIKIEKKIMHFKTIKHEGHRLRGYNDQMNDILHTSKFN